MSAGISRPDIWLGVALNRDSNDPTVAPVWTASGASTFQYMGARDLTEGRDYELAQPLAAQPIIVLRDPSEYLNPANPSSPYVGQVLPYREICSLCQWPIIAAGGNVNLINSGTWRGSNVDAYDPTFESYTPNGLAPNWLEPVGLLGVPTILSGSAFQGTQRAAWSVSTSSTTEGVRIGTPVIPGRQYTTSAYVRQDVANTTAILVEGQNACSDPFYRSTASGWGTPPVGAAYTVTGTAADWSTTPNTGAAAGTGVGQVIVATTGALRYATTGTFYDGDQWITFTAPVLATGDTYRQGLVSRYIDTSNQYQAYMQFETSGVITLIIVKRVASVETVLTSVSLALSYAAGERFRFGLLHEGSSLRAVCWPLGAPPSYLWSTAGVTDTDAALASPGAIGMFAWRAPANTNANLPATFSDYSATGSTLGTTMTATGTYTRLSVTYTANQVGMPAVCVPGVLVRKTSGLSVRFSTLGAHTASIVSFDAVQHEQAAAASTFASAGPVIYPNFRLNVERFTRTWRNRGFEGFTVAPAVDAMAALNKIKISDEADQAILATQPDFFWPLNDGTDTGQFFDQSGNSQTPLSRITSKYGVGTDIEAGTAVPFAGDPNATGVQFTCVTAGGTGPGGRPGTALGNTGPVVMPPVPVGEGPWSLSFACWVDLATNADNTHTLIDINCGRIIVGGNYLAPFTVTVDASTAGVVVNGPNGSGGVGGAAGGVVGGGPHHIAAKLTYAAPTGSATIYVDGVPTTATFAVSANWPSSLAARFMQLGMMTVSGTPGGFMANGTITKAAVWNRALTNTEVLLMYLAGSNGYTAEPSGTRQIRHIQSGGYFGPMRVSARPQTDVGYAVLGPPTFNGSIDLFTDTLNTTFAEQGTQWVQSDGVIAIEGRQDRWLRLASQFTLGSNQAGGEIPYGVDIVMDPDPTYVYPVVTWKRNNGATALGGNVTERGTAAKRYFPRQFDGGGDYNTDQQAQDVADWTFHSHRDALLRVQALIIDPWANPALWPLALSIEPGQRGTVTLRMPAANAGAGLTYSADFFVEKVTHPEINFTQGSEAWTVEVQLSPIGASNAPAGPTMQPWILEHTTYGVLDSTTVLGW